MDHSRATWSESRSESLRSLGYKGEKLGYQQEKQLIRIELGYIRIERVIRIFIFVRTKLHCIRIFIFVRSNNKEQVS